MKKHMFLLIIVGITFISYSNVFSQEENDNRLRLFQKPIEEEKVHFSIGTIYGSEGFGGTLMFHFPSAAGVFFGGEFTDKAQLGLVVGCEPIQLFVRYLYLTTGIEWQYRLKIITKNFHPTPETFQGKDRMLLSVRIGPTLEIKRIGIGAYYNIGQQFLPGKPTQQDWRWLQDFAAVLYVKF